MSLKFKCFIKYKDNKFDLIINEERQTSAKIFAEIWPKIATIFRIALKKQLHPKIHKFELFDFSRETWSLIADNKTEIKPLSVIRITDKPIPPSGGRTIQLITNTVETQFLQKNTNDIIAFYILVQVIDRSFKQINLLVSTANKWLSISQIVVRLYPNIFRGKDYSPKLATNYCSTTFNKLSEFYANNSSKLDLKLEPQIQRRFDMLKIVHILDPKRMFSKDLALKITQLAENPLLKTYLENQEMYGFDVFLNSRRLSASSKMITHKQFVDKYLNIFDKYFDQNRRKK